MRRRPQGSEESWSSVLVRGSVLWAPGITLAGDPLGTVAHTSELHTNCCVPRVKDCSNRGSPRSQRWHVFCGGQSQLLGKETQGTISCGGLSAGKLQGMWLGDPECLLKRAQPPAQEGETGGHCERRDSRKTCGLCPTSKLGWKV